MYLTRAILYYVVAVLWLLRTLNSPNIFDAVLTGILVIGGIVYTVKHLKGKKTSKE